MDRDDFVAGARDTVPVLAGIVPFALVAGVAAVDQGLTVGQAMGLSLVVFAGASQLAIVDLLGRSAPLAVVVVTAGVINLRMMMYSASIAPYFQRYRRRSQAVLAYLLTDQAYAFSIARFTGADGEGVDRRAYYLGAALTLWLPWQLGTVTGAVLGSSVPASWHLEFAVPLVFLALLVEALEDRDHIVAAGVGGTVAVVGAGLPLNLGLVVGAVAGVVAGAASEEVRP
ncbi:MAG: AzlC family ABC transporter permease [Haloarculaceae archaeon]